MLRHIYCLWGNHGSRRPNIASGIRAHTIHVHAVKRKREVSSVTITLEREMASFAPSSIIQQGCNAIWALLRRQLTLISFPIIQTCYDCRLLRRFGSIWFSIISPQGCVQTGPIGAIRFGLGTLAFTFKCGRHNDIIITFMHKSSYISIKTFPFPSPSSLNSKTTSLILISLL